MAGKLGEAYETVVWGNGARQNDVRAMCGAEDW